MNALHILALRSVDWLGKPSPGRGTPLPASDPRHALLLAMLFVTAVLLVVWLTARLQARATERQPRRRPYRLFRHLLNQLGLTRGDRMLLTAIARCRQLKQPAVLLLSPALFAHHTDRWLAESRFAPLWPRAIQRLNRIAQRVFAPPSDPGPDPGD